MQISLLPVAEASVVVEVSIAGEHIDGQREISYCLRVLAGPVPADAPVVVRVGIVGFYP